MLAKEMMRQSLPLLIMCGIGAVIAGSTLGVMVDLFTSIPGLIVIVPAVIALRGNISTAFGSRLGSAYHLGVINADNLWNDELKQNILGSLILSFIVLVIVSILAYFSSILVGVTPDLVKLFCIVVIAGFVSAVILSLMTVGIIYLVFKRGYDPDNITGPALATFGDIVTIFCLFGSALLVEVFL